MYYARKICIHYANFHDCNFFGKNCELLWRQTFFPLKPYLCWLWWCIELPFPCKFMWNFNKIVTYQYSSWNLKGWEWVKWHAILQLITEVIGVYQKVTKERLFLACTFLISWIQLRTKIKQLDQKQKFNKKFLTLTILLSSLDRRN